jgi:copper(I)-binding protein
VSSSTARFPSPRGRRAAFLLTVGTATVALLSACGTGQISQTAQKVSAVEGVSASVQHIDVNDAIVATPEGDKYTKGSDAPVYFTISNDSITDDRLVGAHTDSGQLVGIGPAEAGAEKPALGCVLSASELEEAAAPNPGSTRPEPPAGAEKFPQNSESAGATPSNSASASASASTSGSAKPSASAAPALNTRVNVVVPHDGAVLMTAGCPHLVVRKVADDMLPSDTIKLTLTFARAGVVELDVPVATPSSPLPRVTVPGFGEHGGGNPEPGELGHG